MNFRYLRRLGLLTAIVITSVGVILFGYVATEPSIQGRDLLTLTPIQVPQRGDESAFDLSELTIPRAQIRSGGVAKDGIPAITEPRTVSADQATFLEPQDRIVGVELEGQARAYPISILTQHEIINDQLGDTPIAVTYCPLCDSVVVFDRRTPLGIREFGVSGLLYNSNVLMYDRSQTPSLWSQMKAEGVSGAAAGKEVELLPMSLTTWSQWQERHPNTDVISSNTGYPRDYNQQPYVEYFRSSNLMFPAQPMSRQLPLKEPVLGILDDDHAVAIPASAFGGRSRQVKRQINGKEIEIAFDAESQTLRVIAADPGLQWVNSFWFAWYAFHPQTGLMIR